MHHVTRVQAAGGIAILEIPMSDRLKTAINLIQSIKSSKADRILPVGFTHYAKESPVFVKQRYEAL